MPAKKMGMGTIWVKQGFGGYWQIRGDDERPDYTVKNIIELCDFL